MKKISLLILIFSILIGTFLRVYNLASYPQLNADEAALGYNAYSLILTGKDEFGTKWPLVFRSFDDYKPGIYVYLSIPFIYVLGLNELSVRIPSIILSITSIIFIYLIILQLFKDSKNKHLIASLSSLFLSTSPWHIHFSRGAWETQSSISFLLVGLYFLNKHQQKLIYLFLGTTFYILALYTYHSMRIIVPLMGIYFIIANLKFLINRWKQSVATLLVTFILLVPFIFQIFSPTGISRAQGVSLWSDSGPLWRANEVRSILNQDLNIFTKFTQNQYIYYAIAFFDNYLSHFSINYLFLSGDDIPRSKVPEFGQLPLFWVPLIIYGIYVLIRDYNKKHSIIIFILLISPIASSLTFQSPHAVRSLLMVIPLSIITAIGTSDMLMFIWKKHKFISLITISLLVTTFTFSLIRYYLNYQYLLPYWYPHATQSGTKEIVEYTQRNYDLYDQIWVTDKYDQPYILFLFFSKYPPQEFQSQARLTPKDQYGFATVRNYDKYHFESINWEILNHDDRKILIIGTPEETNTYPALEEIRNEAGTIMYRIISLK